jgi:DNA-binding GntR family transcriptional regulator
MSIRQHRATLEALHKRDVNRSVEAMRTNILGMKCKLGLEEAAQG